MLDFKLALRRALGNPLLTLTIVLSLGVGIGASVSIFSVANAWLLRPQAGVTDPSRLIDLGRTDGGSGFDTSSYPNFVDYRERNSVFVDLCAYENSTQPLGLAGEDGAQTAFGLEVSRNYFSVFGVRPAIGSFFSDSSTPGGSEAVLSHRLWQRRYQGDPGIIGESIRLNGRPFTIVAVTDPEFRGHSLFNPDLWIPLDSLAPPVLLESRLSSWLMMTGRLREDSTLSAAKAEMATRAANLEQEYPEENRGRGLALAPHSLIPAPVQGMIAAFLALLGGLAGAILLIACVNVAGILLARATGRSGELAIRMALGAGRIRLIRQVVLESLVLFVAGGVSALLISRWILNLLVSAVPQLPLPISLEISLDGSVFVFCVLITLLAALLTAIAPALGSTRPNLMNWLRAGETGRSGRLLLRRGLLAGQVALVCLLLVTAALFWRSLHNAGAIDPGFEVAGVQTYQLNLTQGGFGEVDGRQVANEILHQVRTIPEITVASLSRQFPLDGSGFSLGGVRPMLGDSEASVRNADWNVVSTEYFATAGIPLIEGRDFNDGDREGTVDVAIVNQTLAQSLWPGQSALGKRFLDGPLPDGRERMVIGVARDAKYRSLGEDPRLFVYVPFEQTYTSTLNLFVRHRAGSANPTPAVRAAIAEIAPNLPIITTRSLREAAQVGLTPQTVALFLAAGLGLVGVLLAALGVYGITAQTMQQRTRELAIRSALGAPRRRLLGMALRQGMVAVLIGTLVGLTGAAASTFLIRGLLYGISPLDPVSFAAAGLLLSGIALLACYFPARRAVMRSPAAILRD